MSDFTENRLDALSVFFNTPAILNDWKGKLTGPGLSLPEAFKAFELSGELDIEYLRVGFDEEGGDEANKNHVVLRVPFKESYTLKVEGETVEVFGARISMDMTREVNALENIDKDRLEEDFTDKSLCDDFLPGTLYVKVLKFSEESQTANKVTKFSGLGLTTLGEFVAFIKDRRLHEMVFLGYGQAWKGCRDFVAQTFLQLREASKISETDDEGNGLKYNITKVHHRGQGYHNKLIDRGQFLAYTRIFPKEIEGGYEDSA